jgi:WD40 repeat protein
VLTANPGGSDAASGGEDGKVRLWSGQVFSGHVGPVHALAFTPDGQTLVSGGRDGSVRLWSVADGQVRKIIDYAHSGNVGGTVRALAVSPDGKLLISAGEDRSVRLWSLPQGDMIACLMDLKASPGSVQGIEYAQQDEAGKTVSRTLPCGSPIRVGDVCTCNCVSVSWSPPPPPMRDGGGTHYWYPN